MLGAMGRGRRTLAGLSGAGKGFLLLNQASENSALRAGWYSRFPHSWEAGEGDFRTLRGLCIARMRKRNLGWFQPGTEQ
jgi:hypothetical protein